MKRLICLIILSLTVCGAASAQILAGLDKVKEVKMLESTRDDIRRIFAGFKSGKQADADNAEAFYTDDFSIEIDYSDGKSCNEDSDGWNTSKNIVTRITFSPKSTVKLIEVRNNPSKFGIEFSKLRREKEYINNDDLYKHYSIKTGIVLDVYKDEIQEINYQTTHKQLNLLCDQETAKILLKSKSIFTASLKERHLISDVNTPSDVVNLITSLSEITAICSSNSEQNKTCSNNVKVIAVFAIGADPENDIVTFDFKVSGGSIVKTDERIPNVKLRNGTLGQAAHALWDLTGVKPGTYTITVAVDDGCGFCGKTMTKTVVVKKCPDCH